MIRDPDHDAESRPGGRAAERLRQHLQARFPDAAPDDALPTAEEQENAEEGQAPPEGEAAPEDPAGPPVGPS